MNKKSLSVKIAVMVASLIIATVVIVVTMTLTAMGDIVSDLTVGQTTNAINSVFATLEDYTNQAQERANLLSKMQNIYDPIEAGDTGRLRAALIDVSEGVDFVTVTDANGIVIGRSHNSNTGDSIMNQKVISTAISTGSGISTIESGTTVPLAVRASSVIKDPSGNLIAVVSCGFDLANPQHVDEIKQLTGTEVTLFFGDTRLATTLINDKGERAVGTQAAPDVAETVLNKGQTYSEQKTLFGSKYQTYYSPLIVDDEIIGMVFCGLNVDDMLAQQQRVILIIVSVVVIVLLCSIVLIVLSLKKMVIKPLKVLTSFMKRAGETGDVNMRPEEEAALTHYKQVDDELGHCIKGTLGFIRHIAESAHELDIIANGDLTLDIEVESDADTLGISAMKMAENLIKVLSEINSSTEQVTDGSMQISAGAQLLAQGSTQQAASIEQLSAAVTEIAEKTHVNAQNAEKAAGLSRTIKASAEKGEHQMEEMMIAVKDINQASQSISKVIKVIDDIAFQTNILALNAAVEAARAGQHGKGFSVVAEEVRNLASKSADAAKETGALITDSAEKAELGSRIASDTYTSLHEIVAGINESASIVSDIAILSEEQSLAIMQINEGINQVAQVVQQNSATAEQSAAASEQVSAQAIMLNELVHQFKLKGNS